MAQMAGSIPAFVDRLIGRGRTKSGPPVLTGRLRVPFPPLYIGSEIRVNRSHSRQVDQSDPQIKSKALSPEATIVPKFKT
jgi:hypothetical protein